MLDPIHLTDSEARVVTMLFEGRSRKFMAQELGVAEVTVNYHLHRVYKRAGVKNAIGLVARTWKNGGFLY